MTQAPSMPEPSSSSLQSYPLLRTKLHIPQARPGARVVSRPRLVEQLMRGMTRPLTLLSAPAGYGKTTLLSEWVADLGSRISDLGTEVVDKSPIPNPQSKIQNQVAWLSLDEKDNDPVRFWTYIFSALETIQPGLTEQALAQLHSPQPPASAPRGDENEQIEMALTTLINALAARPMEFALALDDYHVIESPLIHSTLAFLLNHLPPQAHLFVASRADPPWPLSQLRVRGQLVELRADDLRFTPEEAAAFLNEVMGLGLAPQDVAALEARTEGWIAGLQLASLALQAPLAAQGGDDVSGFIAAFTGSNRYILDYLVEQVLRRHPASVQNFMLQTCILDRLCGPLCDAVIGVPPLAETGPERSGQAMLEMLEQANLFTIPLDEERRWYRYHHLFADFLQSRLRQAQPDRAAELHRRAAEWHEQNGLIAEAIDHALAAQDFERAGRLIEQMAEAILMRSEAITLLNWLNALPEALVHSRPRLCVFHALAMLILGQLDAVEPHLQDAEKNILPDDTSTHAAEVRGQIAGLRAMLAAYQGDVLRAIELAHQAGGHLSTDSPFLRSMLAWLMGFAYYLNDDVEASRQAFVESIEISQATGNALTALLSAHLLGYQQMVQGRLRQATETYQHSLQFLERIMAGKQPFPITCMAYFGLGEVLREQNDLESAERYLKDGLEIGRQLKNSEMLVDGFLSLVRLKLARRETNAALSLIQEARQSLPEEMFPFHKLLIETWQARLWIAQGNLAAAAEWAARQEDEPILKRRAGSTPLSVRAVEHPTLARLWIAQREFDQALDLLTPLRQEAEAGQRVGVVIEALALEALALDGLRQRDRALAALSRALELAEPEGYVRIFVDEGEPMRLLIADCRLQIVRQPHSRTQQLLEYTDKLLAAFDEGNKPKGKEPGGEPLPSVIRPSSLVEPLSKRELEVLRLIADGFSNQEIAEKLVISLSTVKTHINHIFDKLNTTSRTRAVVRAKELGLL